MKKNLLILIYFFCFTTNAQIINFPDSNFLNKLLQSSPSNSIATNILNNQFKIDSNNNGFIEQLEALQVKSLNIGFSNIFDLTGVEYFSNLQNLSFSYTFVSNFHFPQLNSLKLLYCPNSNISTLNLSGLSSLEVLNVNVNNISNIDFSNLINLKQVYCEQNQLTNLDFSNNPMLVELVCSSNLLTNINIKNGITQPIGNQTIYQNCWNSNNPNLTTICADTNEVTPLQTFLATCNGIQPLVTSNCGLGSEEFVANKVVLYPNPTNNFVTLHNEEGFFTTVVIYNYLGQELKQLSIVDEMTTIDLSNFSKGIYFLNLLGEKNEVVKIIKQ